MKPEDACLKLLEIANHYGVIRTLRKEPDGISRLSPVWSALKEIQCPKSEDDAVRHVEELVVKLREDYKLDLKSAASKFLWMRFGAPIVVYDSLALKWLRDNEGYRDTGNYVDYYAVWRSAFLKHQEEIRLACLKLDVLKPFLRSTDISDTEFGETISSKWFAERVLDHAMLNAPYDR